MANEDPDIEQPEIGGVELAPGVVAPAKALRFTFTRSSGPGGQNVNKLNTRAQLRIAPDDLAPLLTAAARQRLVALAGPARLTSDGELMIAADVSRSQHANRQTCLDRLRELLVQAMRPRRVRRATKPSAGAKQRRLEGKKRRSDVKRTRRPPSS
jgi:ribosome-associated protein